MNGLSVQQLALDIMSMNRAIRSGSPRKIIKLVLRKPAITALAATAKQTERQWSDHKPPAARRVASILERVAHRTENRRK